MVGGMTNDFGPTYTEVTAPFELELTRHVYGCEDQGPCWDCAAQLPCTGSSEIRGRMDVAVSRWLMGLEKQPLEALRGLSGPISDRMREDEALSRARDDDEMDLPGEPRS